MKCKNNIDMARINDLVRLPILEAQRSAITIINECSYKNGAKRIRVLEDIKKARRSSEVARILCYVILAGEGLSVINAPWQKEFA